ncbi:MAG: hypothetical protein KGL39_34490 [Patescibacteria group bacterium]|nr:hypothetical protein [Patescibacteria group bacterium]
MGKVPIDRAKKSLYCMGIMSQKLAVLSPVTNDAAPIIEDGFPYAAKIGVVGTAPYLFHRWSVESVEAKSNAAKGSKSKKEDDIESYVYRDDKGNLAIPGEQFRMAIINAAKFKQDPRSPRKSAMDLFKAGIACLDPLCSLNTKNWDILDRRRVMVQRNGITRTRPSMNAGWKCELQIQVLLPEYISLELLNEVIQNAGRLCGVGDFRPTYGRFQVVAISYMR